MDPVIDTITAGTGGRGGTGCTTTHGIRLGIIPIHTDIMATVGALPGATTLGIRLTIAIPITPTTTPTLITPTIHATGCTDVGILALPPLRLGREAAERPYSRVALTAEQRQMCNRCREGTPILRPTTTKWGNPTTTTVRITEGTPQGQPATTPPTGNQQFRATITSPTTQPTTAALSGELPPLRERLSITTP